MYYSVHIPAKIHIPRLKYISYFINITDGIPETHHSFWAHWFSMPQFNYFCPFHSTLALFIHWRYLEHLSVLEMCTFPMYLYLLYTLQKKTFSAFSFPFLPLLWFDPASFPVTVLGLNGVCIPENKTRWKPWLWYSPWSCFKHVFKWDDFKRFPPTWVILWCYGLSHFSPSCKASHPFPIIALKSHITWQ